MLFEQEFIGSRILREVRRQGYTGGPTALYDDLRKLRASRPSARVTERFETAPGQQGQFDWSPYTVLIADVSVRLVVFCLTLAYSRRKCYWASLDESQRSVFEAIDAALGHFGGAPKEVLVDNAKAFVVNASPTHFAWNPRFLELCGHYGIQPVACQPARPQTKGKVERPFFYLEQHFIKGHSWESFDAFCRDLATFTREELDTLVHTTTGERPIDRFAQERPALTPLPVVPRLGSHEELRKVSWDCLVSFGGSRYSVPWAYAGQQVWLRPTQGVRLTVRSQAGQEVARHDLATRKGSTVIDPTHYADLRAALPKTKAVVTDTFRRRFPDHEWFLDGVFQQHQPNGTAHLRAILALADVYPDSALVAAFATARQYAAYSHGFIRRLLEASGASPQVVPFPHHQPPGFQSGVGADLRVYQQLLEAQR